MKLCPKCSRSPLPFIMILLIASVLSYITWLILGLSQIDPVPRLAVGVAVFIGIGATLLHYVISCLKRHCRHDHTHQGAPSQTFSRPA